MKNLTWRFWCLLLALSAVSSGGPWAQDTGTGRNGEISESALNRLIEISSQLSTLNERLQTELLDSRRSSMDLQNMLDSSRQELDELRTELTYLRSSSEELLITAESSQRELTGLLLALRRAESSLMSLELSFTAYRETAEGRIRTLERENRLWKWGCAAAGVLAGGLGAAFLLGR
ncbi:MAG: hypothetical protein FWH12_08495 [Treponema sp.]|nr:hypothetical protein [Treponema sp.]